MPCFCSAQLDSLLPSLSRIPSLAGLLPPIPALLLPALCPPTLAVGPAAFTASANASLTSNLAIMMSLRADVKAAMGMNLMACLASGPLQASLQASLSQTIGSMNANSGMLLPYQDLLSRLLRELADLMRLAGVVMAARATFGIDLRAAGAVPMLQARIAAMARAQAQATGRLAIAAPRLGAAASMMASLGFPATPAGALSLGASMQALSRLTLGLPVLTANLSVLSLLAALLAMLKSILSALGVNMLAANAMTSLRLSLGALPLAALASMQLQANANASASISAAASASLSALAALNLRAATGANLVPAGRLAVAMQLAANANMLMLPAGQCGRPCPVAALLPA